ncbi:cytidine deaminase [Morganella morganii]|uniref:anti-phage dCTP deaminase n=1 Tax=Morganella morganii TaxID=582 RepID=UPI000D1E9D41|nr:anti-phage dCTP deaminase [Morganella morganii]HAE78319.1 cytidine deaminase [Morganella sp. (in: enterobacteria)]QXO43453.1 cytidine deaminase [Morganella morganii]QXO47044.1 cytidine deaminase [Morganella morganii]QXO50813.1 cytidine deaminase [Morganella morganii]QXO58544.1 cytidine deaminase [Morganella morganii]
MEINYDGFNNSEVVIGLVGAVGVDLEQVFRIIEKKFNSFKYNSELIKISSDVIPGFIECEKEEGKYQRINYLMNKGNEIRKSYQDNSILAKGFALHVNLRRKDENKKDELMERTVWVVSSLKTPEEVNELRKIYSDGFYLFGIYSSEERRFQALTENKEMEGRQAEELIERDKDESDDYGQKTRDTYHLSDFFINYDGNFDKFSHDIGRVIDLLFGHPYITPTFDEYAMYMAFSAALRSGDLSRQVGAVVTKDQQIMSTGANDVPRSGGGLYWPHYDEKNLEIIDVEDGRDYKKKFDSNKKEQKEIIDGVINSLKKESNVKFNKKQIEEIEFKLKKSRIKDITEYGRVVHAEMEAILSCARNYVSTKGSELYCTTFPCHNCAKHIIASGIKRVTYIEPYPKSKATKFHSDSIILSDSDNNNEDDEKEKIEKVIFEPFVGVGPKSFLKLFSISLGGGNTIKRKDADGNIVDFNPKSAKLKTVMLPSSYIERERYAASQLFDKKRKIE